MELGASFSHPHLESLGLNPQKSLKEFKNLGLRWIRLGCYWNEVEPKKNRFSFRELDSLMEYCNKNDLYVVLTNGMKAPRYLEYYIPKWILEKENPIRLSIISDKFKFLSERIINFIDICTKRYKNIGALKVWQIENEPLDPSGPKWFRIDFKLLEKEISTVKNIDRTRKILVNCWGNELTKRRVYRKIVRIADTVGFDLYLRHPVPFLKFLHKYFGPLDSPDKIKSVVKEIKSPKKGFWITELQAEPWEPNEIWTKKKNPPSFLPKYFASNLDYASQFEPEVTLLWGFEYWLWKKERGDSRYWDRAKKMVQKYNENFN